MTKHQNTDSSKQQSCPVRCATVHHFNTLFFPMKFIRISFRRKIIFSFGRLVKFIILWILFLRLLVSCVIRHKTNLFHAFLLIFCRRIFPLPNFLLSKPKFRTMSVTRSSPAQNSRTISNYASVELWNLYFIDSRRRFGRVFHGLHDDRNDDDFRMNEKWWT